MGVFQLALLHFSVNSAPYDTGGKDHGKCSVWEWLQLFLRSWQGHGLTLNMAIFIKVCLIVTSVQSLQLSRSTWGPKTDLKPTEGQQKHQSAHTGGLRGAGCFLRKLCLTITGQDKQDCLSEQTRPSQELWNLVSIKKVPREPETHLELFHRELIWGTWLALYSTFKITTFH